MFYYRRIWAIVLGFLSLALIVCKFSYYVTIKMLIYGFNASNMNSMFDEISKILQLLILLIIVTLLIWFLFNIKSKRFVNDFKSAQLSTYLRRVVKSDEQLQLNKYEEHMANHHINWLRINFTSNGKLEVNIPCGRMGSIYSVINERCLKNDVISWLSAKYEGTYWKPAKKLNTTTGISIRYMQK